MRNLLKRGTTPRLSRVLLLLKRHALLQNGVNACMSHSAAETVKMGNSPKFQTRIFRRFNLTTQYVDKNVMTSADLLTFKTHKFHSCKCCRRCRWVWMNKIDIVVLI